MATMKNKAAPGQAGLDQAVSFQHDDEGGGAEKRVVMNRARAAAAASEVSRSAVRLLLEVIDIR